MERQGRFAAALATLLALTLPAPGSSEEPRGHPVVPPHWLDGLPSDEVYVVPDPIMLRQLGEMPPTTVDSDLLTVGTRIKRRLERDQDIRVRKLEVATSGGDVTLTGEVDTEAQRERALASAREASGDTDTDVDVESAIVVDADAEQDAERKDATTQRDRSGEEGRRD